MTKLNIVDGHIDRITIVGDMKRDKSTPLALQFLGTSTDPRIRGPYLVNKGNYSRNVDLMTHGSTAKIEMNDRKVDVSDFRLDFNPAKCSEDDMKFIRRLLSMVKHKRCTRIDLCINFHDDVMGYQLVDGRKRKETLYKGASGRLETMYRGSERSEDYIRFYDKKKQQKDVKYKDIEHDWCRLEEVIQFKKAESYKKWEWFKGIKLVNSKPTFSEDIDPKDRMVAKCIMAGLDDIRELKRAYREKIQKIIDSATYEDEFDVFAEIKKTSIVVETNEVLNQLLSD